MRCGENGSFYNFIIWCHDKNSSDNSEKTENLAVIKEITHVQGYGFSFKLTQKYIVE